MPFVNPTTPVNFINKSTQATGTADIDAAFLNTFQNWVDVIGDGLATYSSDLETLETAVTALGTPFTNPGHISGLKVEYVSATQIRVTSGSCYFPATNRIISKSTNSTITPSGLVADQWYYVYAIDTAGSISFEVVTTQPAIYYGIAKQKSGDSSRRYVGGFRTFVSSADIMPTRTVNDLVMYTNTTGAWNFNPQNLGTNVSNASLITFGVTDGGSHDSVPHLCRMVKIEGENIASAAGAQLVLGDPATLSGTVYEHFIEHGGGGRTNFSVTATLNDSGQIGARTVSSSSGNATFGVTGYHIER